MSDCVTSPLNQTHLDPCKRVNYFLGQVMGVDEFQQEQIYFLENDRLQNRALHGYGTISGLKISVRMNESSEPQIVVGPGLAVDTLGRYVCMTKDRCGSLNRWLSENQKQLPDSDKLERLQLYVNLYYRECETNNTYVPGGPCRTQDESVKGSRISEDCNLELNLTPPPQIEEDTIKLFGELLKRIEITDEQGRFLDKEDLLKMVRELVNQTIPTGHFRLHPDHASAWLREAFQVWVTEVRPKLFPVRQCNQTTLTASKESVQEACILLAKLDVGLEKINGCKYQVKLGEQKKPDVFVDESNRPYLLSTRLLQEWLMCGGYLHETHESQAFATTYAVNNSTLQVWVHYPQKISNYSGAITVNVNGSVVDSSVSANSPNATTQILTLTLTKRTFHDNDRIIVEFDTTKLKIRGRPLYDLLEESNDIYLYRQGTKLLSYLVIDWPALDDLSDVNAANPKDNDILTWNETNKRWETRQHIHSIFDIKGVYTNHAKQGDVLVFEEDTKLYLKPKPYYLDAPAKNGDVLTWVEYEDGHGEWKPKAPEYTQTKAGNYVHVPADAGVYSIVAAGYFDYDAEKDVCNTVKPSYNDLEGDRVCEGIYRLHFPGFHPVDGHPFPAYIVKAMVVNDGLQRAFNDVTNNPINERISQATIQIASFSEKYHYVELWITQPVLMKDIDNKNYNVRFLPIDLPFMVEISQYGVEGPTIFPPRIDIRTASEKELESLPQIGPVLAKRIIDTRNNLAEPLTIKTLTDIQGISEESAKEIRHLITFKR